MENLNNDRTRKDECSEPSRFSINQWWQKGGQLLVLTIGFQWPAFVDCYFGGLNSMANGEQQWIFYRVGCSLAFECALGSIYSLSAFLSRLDKHSPSHFACISNHVDWNLSMWRRFLSPSLGFHGSSPALSGTGLPMWYMPQVHRCPLHSFWCFST